MCLINGLMLQHTRLSTGLPWYSPRITHPRVPPESQDQLPLHSKGRKSLFNKASSSARERAVGRDCSTKSVSSDGWQSRLLSAVPSGLPSKRRSSSPTWVCLLRPFPVSVPWWRGTASWRAFPLSSLNHHALPSLWGKCFLLLRTRQPTGENVGTSRKLAVVLSSSVAA